MKYRNLSEPSGQHKDLKMPRRTFCAPPGVPNKLDNVDARSYVVTVVPAITTSFCDYIIK